MIAEVSMTIKLTKTTIEKLVYQESGPKKQIVWDTQLPGFGVRVYPSGKKAFVLAYRSGGRKQLMVIGSVNIFTVEEARERARKHQVDVVDGHDPLTKRQHALRSETVEELCGLYIERHAKRRKKTWQDNQHYLNKHVLPTLGRLKVANIQTADIAKLHNRIGQKHPYSVNRVVKILVKMFSLAKIWGIVEYDHHNPAPGIEKFKEKKRNRWLTHDGLPRVTNAIAEEQDIYIRYAFFLYLLTGLRKTARNSYNSPICRTF